MEVLLVMIIIIVVAYHAVKYLTKSNKALDLLKKMDDVSHSPKKCCGKMKKTHKPKVKVKGMKAKVHHKMKKPAPKAKKKKVK